MSRRLPVALVAVALLAGSLWAGEAPETPAPPPPAPAAPAMGPLGRLLRGFRDVLISPLEIPATMRRVAAEYDPAYALFAGSTEGLGNGLVRLAAGFIEIVSFPIPSDTFPLYNKRLGERALPPLRVPTDLPRP